MRKGSDFTAEKDIIELELYLIRHGQSVTNAADEREIEAMPYCMREDPVLSETGEIQARLLGERFAQTELDAVYSSCLIRAVQTANGILTLQQNEKPLFVDPVFSETRLPSHYRGTSIERLREFCANAVPRPGADFSGGLIEGNENDTDADIQKRAERALNTILSLHGGGEKVAVVLHAGFLTHMVFYLLGFKEKLPDDVDISFRNTSVTKIVFYKKGTHPYGSVVLRNINDTSHLEKDLIT